MQEDSGLPVSVIMGTLYTKDSLYLLKRSVESILNQTFSEFEFIICDSGSSPNAMKFLEELVDYRIRLVRRDSCLDLASKLNLCLKAARGQYIARMDDDDWSHPDRLEKEYAFLEDNNDIGFTGCNVSLIRDGAKVGQRNLPQRPKIEDFYMTQPYIHPALMFRKEALDAVKGYSESRDCILCEDYDLLLRIYKEGFVGANIQECLLDYTLSSDAKGNRKMRHRINETKTRYMRFRDLGVLPRALPYVIKPLLVGLLPKAVLSSVKKSTREKS